MVLFVYAIFLGVIMSYHEPWADEAQAWLIARDATIKELLTSITHYEGHPPIWFMLLMPFAKLGIPFEFGVKCVNFLIMTTAISTFIFKAPFPRLVRYVIPFTYFFFYQYGVISRPYSLMLLGFVLSAVFYKDRHSKPFYYATALLIVCSASAYGIMFTAGIATVWLWEALGKKCTAQAVLKLIKSRTFLALLMLLVVNILYVICIIPYSDAFGIADYSKASRLQMLLYLFIVAPGDATFSTSYYGISSFNIQTFISCALIGILINGVLVFFTKCSKKLPLFIIPYTLFACFAALNYFAKHHLGIIAMFYLFICWCCIEEPEYRNNAAFRKLSRIVRMKKYYSVMILVVTSIIMIIPLFWSAVASINDINISYSSGRETAQYFESNNLLNYNILSSWKYYKTKDGLKLSCDYNFQSVLPVQAYFSRNIFYCLNEGRNSTPYLLCKTDTLGKDLKEKLSQKEPEVLYATADSSYTFGKLLNMNNYILVKEISEYPIWKSDVYMNIRYIYLRKDLAFSLNIADVSP